MQPLLVLTQGPQTIYQGDISELTPLGCAFVTELNNEDDLRDESGRFHCLQLCLSVSYQGLIQQIEGEAIVRSLHRTSQTGLSVNLRFQNLSPNAYALIAQAIQSMTESEPHQGHAADTGTESRIAC